MEHLLIQKAKTTNTQSYFIRILNTNNIYVSRPMHAIELYILRHILSAINVIKTIRTFISNCQQI